MAFDEKKGKTEETKPLIVNEEPLRLEPKEVKPAPGDIPPVIKPKRPLKVSPKGAPEREEDRAKVSGKLPETEIGAPLKRERKSSPFFKLLFILSLAFMAAAVGLLLLPLLNVPIPAFLTAAIDLVSR